MNSVTSIVYKYLDEFSIDFRTESLYEKYKEFSQKINIEDFVQYKDIKNKSRDFSKEIFHVVVSVKVSNDTPFIPFISVLGEDQEGLENMARELQRKGSERISYNYSSFLEDIEKQQGRKLMRLSFDTLFENHNISISNARIIPQEISKEKLWFEKQEEDVKGDNIDAQVFEFLSADGSFAKELARAYFDKFGMRKIYFSIYSMDSDYNGRSFLTRVMLIGTSSRECEFYLKRRLDRIRDFVSCIRTRYTHDLYRRNLWEAMKSAKAAIISRNMSHNLGSHVMFYIKQKLQSVSKIIDNKVLANIIPGELSDLKTVEQKIKENKDVELPFLVGLGRFINYLQERQDYIATVATDYIPARSTISFKDFIYDELKPELRYLRHHSNNQNGDAGWQSGNLLLDYIAYSEDYCSSDDIVIKFGNFDGLHSKDGNGDEIVDFQDLRKFNIAIPGGVIGRQAIFSIFENIIRNAAKHSERREDNKLVLQLSIIKNKEDLNKLIGTGTLRTLREGEYFEKSSSELVKLYENSWDTYYYLRIKIDMPNQPKSVNKLVESLADPYIENGVMKETAKGLKEMRISGAWLRGYSIDTQIPLSEPSVLSIYSEPYDQNKDMETISYILCIPKPQKVAFLVKDNTQYEELNKCIEPFGCKVFGFNNDVFDEYENINDAIPNYEIVCMIDDKDLKAKIYPQISSRYICSSNITIDIVNNLMDMLENTTNKDELTASLKSEIDTIYDIWYEYWIQTTCSDRKEYKLTILDDKAIDNSKNQNLKENYAIADNQTVILDTTGNINLDYCTNAVVYKTHFKGLQTEPKDSYLSNAVCIESITGNNSTARFIRQDKWNKMWKSKLLSSGIAKVAIFDERIYSTFVASNGTQSISHISKLIKDKSKSEDEIVDELIKIGFTEDEAYAIAYKDPGFNEIIESKCKQYNVDVAQKNHERGIWAFDIVPLVDAVAIKGYNVCIDNKVNTFVKRYPEETIVATIKKSGEEYSIVDVNDTIFPNGTNIFDFISIHLGILDKIYNAFKIKGNEGEMRKVTNAIHQFFSRMDTPSDYNDFLPNFIIHSGRAKPSKADMPQEQPFVQFAAIDYAVKDCKYTLVELLISAYHENSNSYNKRR